MLAWPGQANRAGGAHVLGKARIELAVVKGLRVKHGLALARPMRGEPRAHLRAQSVACAAQVVARQCAWVCAAGDPGSTGTPDSTSGTSGTSGTCRNAGLPQRRAAEGTGSRCEIAPVGTTRIVLRSSVGQRQTHALKTDKAIGQLVLHRLKAANEFAKLLTLFRVVQRHLKRTPRRAVRARQETQAPDQMQIGTECCGPFNHLRGATGQRHFGYGQTGAAAGRPAYAPVVHAASGFDQALAHYAGERSRPAAGAIFIADVLGGIYACSGIQTALLQRVYTGLGQQIDVALMDCMLNLLVYELQAAQLPAAAPRFAYGPIRAADGDLLVAPITQRNFIALCDAIGQPELKQDPRFATVPARTRHWHALMACAETWTSRRSVDQCIEVLEAGGVPCSHYGEPGDALTNPDLIARGTFAQVRDGGGEFTGINAPYRMSGTGVNLGGSVPAKGEHTASLLRDLLGLSEAGLLQARDQGLFGK